MQPCSKVNANSLHLLPGNISQICLNNLAQSLHTVCTTTTFLYYPKFHARSVPSLTGFYVWEYVHFFSLFQANSEIFNFVVSSPNLAHFCLQDKMKQNRLSMCNKIAAINTDANSYLNLLNELLYSLNGNS